MKKGRLHLTCLLFSGILSLVVYFFLMRAVFIAGWNFHIDRYDHWLFAWRKWNAGWVIKNPREILYFTLLVLLIPGWLFTWTITYILPWKKILGWPMSVWKERKKRKLLQKSIEAAKGPAALPEALAAKKTPKEHPKGLRISPDKVKEIDKLRGRKTSGMPAPAPRSPAPEQPRSNVFSSGNEAGTFAEGGNFIEAGTPVVRTGPTREEQALERVRLWEGISEALERNNVFIFREMKIHGYATNIIAVTAESVFILSEGPAVGEKWLVAEEETIPVWKVGKDAIASPLRPLVKARDDMKEYLEKEQPACADMTVNACLILDHGNIENPKELIETLETWDISVLKMGTCTTEMLPGTSALMEYIKSQPPSSQEINDAVAVAILDLMESDFVV